MIIEWTSATMKGFQLSTFHYYDNDTKLSFSGEWRESDSGIYQKIESLMTYRKKVEIEEEFFLQKNLGNETLSWI